MYILSDEVKIYNFKTIDTATTSDLYTKGAFTKLQRVRWAKIGGSLGAKVEPGDYLLEFEADGETFYRFPFSVVKLSRDDPYDPKDVWIIDG